MALRHPIQAEAPHLEAMVRQKCHGGDSAHAWYGHQAAAGRAFADHLKHHFMKYSALLPKGSARDQHGARSVLFDGTDRGGRKRDVQTNIVLHGVLLRVLGSEGDRGVSVIRNHPIYDDAVNETVEILISGGFSTCT
jgi:hypothetical protein